MSKNEDEVIEGDGPNRGDSPIRGEGDPSESGQAAVSSRDAEGGGRQGDDQPKTASKGINPVQHSE